MIYWENEKERIDAMIADGVTYEYIGKIYGCTGANIKKQAKKLGITLPKRRAVNKKETFNRGKRSKKCLNCGKEIDSSRGSFCSPECYTEYQYRKNIEKWKNGEISGCDKSGNMSPFVRKYVFDKNGYKCEKCGFGAVNPYTNLSILQIHHIDGDCFNNSEENLSLLCPNCHAMTENFGRRNDKSSRVNRYKK